jgi:hypothetical protein
VSKGSPRAACRLHAPTKQRILVWCPRRNVLLKRLVAHLRSCAPFSVVLRDFQCRPSFPIRLGFQSADFDNATSYFYPKYIYHIKYMTSMRSPTNNFLPSQKVIAVPARGFASARGSVTGRFLLKTPATPPRSQAAPAFDPCRALTALNHKRRLLPSLCESLWARQGSNLRPVVYKTTALPLSYAPEPPYSIQKKAIVLPSGQTLPST